MRNMALLLVLLTLTGISLSGHVLRKAEAIEEGQHVIVKRATGPPPMLGAGRNPAALGLLFTWTRGTVKTR
jgi:hypothetical protein